MPLDLALWAGYERSFYEEDDWHRLHSWGWNLGGSVSRPFQLTDWLSVSPRLGLEWNWNDVRYTDYGYSYQSYWTGEMEYSDNYNTMVAEVAIMLEYALSGGQSIFLDNRLQTWKHRRSGDRLFEYILNVGVRLPR